MSDDADFFTHKIEKRIEGDGGCEEITLSCGHVLIAVVPVSGDEMPCGQCVNDYIEKIRMDRV